MSHPVLVGGQWRPARGAATFHATNPRTCEPLPDEYPVSGWDDCEEALRSATQAAADLRRLDASVRANFLDEYARRIESRRDALIEVAHLETGLPKSPRLAEAELPRTTGQLRQAAAAAREGTWAMPTIDTKGGLRSELAPVGPICVFGPNNFPFAFGSVSGGDFAAAIAAGNPVIAKAHTSHPTTTRIFAEEAFVAALETGMPRSAVQLVYRLDHADGARLVSDRRVGATGYTGGRQTGLALKAAADAAGKPIYLELSSINPVLILPGALQERLDEIAAEFASSCLLGTGQFCTNPGLIILFEGELSDRFIQTIADKFGQAPVGTLLSEGVARLLAGNVATLIDAGARPLVGNQSGGGVGVSFANTWLRVTAEAFLARPSELQTEIFGNAALCVVAHDTSQAKHVLDALEGNLTGCVYSHRQGLDDALYDALAPSLRRRVGRLLNDKMPTGVAVSPAMHHGGPFPATGHPGFTAVGIPASLRRFAALECYDNVRPRRLPTLLRDENTTRAWRYVDGAWTQADLG